MRDRVTRPFGGASAIFNGGVRMALYAPLPDAIDRGVEPIRLPPAANDRWDAGPDAASMLSCPSMFWLDLIEVEGHILLAMNYDGDTEALRESRRLHGRGGAEAGINTVFLEDLFDTDKFSEAELIQFGTVICQSLRARATRAFPDRSFVTELFTVTDGDRIGVRLYQENRQ